MNFLKTFESRVSDAFGSAPQGYTAPFSFKRLAKRAAREMEAETFIIDGVETAPALYTILVSSVDDAAMRLLYPQLVSEIVAFVQSEANGKGYVFVGEPLARFMVDPALRSGKFAVFAENIDATTLARLRKEEEEFLSGASAVGGAAADLSARKKSHASHRKPTKRADAPVLTPIPERKAEPSAVTPIPAPVSPDDSVMGLDVLPFDYMDDQYQQAAGEGVVPQTQRRVAPVESAFDPGPAPTPSAPEASCLLIDHQSGRTYTVNTASATIGRERTPGGVVLHDPNVSRRHAQLSFDGSAWHIKDLGSTNGTMVNDVDVPAQVLHNGDIITLGLMNLEFREN